MVFIRKYNVTLDATTAGSLKIAIPIRKAGSNDFATGSDWTPAAGDVKVGKDRGAQANITTLPTFSNGRWEFVLSNTELSAKQIEVTIVDAATKAVDDEAFIVETFGSASAMWPTDYADAVRMGMTALPNAAAGSAVGMATQPIIAQLLCGYNAIAHVRKGGNDTTGDGSVGAPFLTIAKALTVVSAYTMIKVGPGDFDEGTTSLNTIDDIGIVGSGRDTTRILSQVALTAFSGCIIRLRSRVRIADMTIQGNAASGTSQAPVGVSAFDGQFTNVRLERLRLIADSDGVYVAVNNCSFVAEDMQVDTNYDCFAFFNPVQCSLRRVNARALGPSGVSSGSIARCLNNQHVNSVINAYDCSFVAMNATTTTTGIENAAGGTIRLFGNTSVYARSSSGTVKDLITGNNVTAAGSITFDSMRVTGTVIAAGAAGQEWGRVLNPGATVDLPNTTIDQVTLAPAQAFDNIGTWSGSLTGNIGGSVVGSVGSVAGNIGGNLLGFVTSLGATAKSDVQAAMTTQGYTSSRAGALGSLSSMIVSNQFTSNALALAPTGGGTGGSLVITPFQAVTTNPRYSTKDLPPIAQGSTPADVWVITDGTGAPLDLTGKTLRLVAALTTSIGTDRDSAVDDTLASSFKYETGGSGITVGGTDHNQVTVQHSAVKTSTPGKYNYYLWDVTSGLLLATGRMPIVPAALDV